MRTRNHTKHFNPILQQKLRNIKSKILNEEVIGMAISLHAYPSIIADKYSEECVLDILPEIVLLLNKYDECLNEKSELLEHNKYLKNIMDT